MMKIQYVCDVCGRKYGSAKKAADCEIKLPKRIRLSALDEPWKIGECYVTVDSKYPFQCFKIIGEEEIGHYIVPRVRAHTGIEHFLGLDEDTTRFSLINEEIYTILSNHVARYEGYIEKNGRTVIA